MARIEKSRVLFFLNETIAQGWNLNTSFTISATTAILYAIFYKILLSFSQFYFCSCYLIPVLLFCLSTFSVFFFRFSLQNNTYSISANYSHKNNPTFFIPAHPCFLLFKKIVFYTIKITNPLATASHRPRLFSVSIIKTFEKCTTVPLGDSQRFI